MPELAQYAKLLGTKLLSAREALIPLILIGIVVIMLAPLNTVLMDFLLIINVTMSVMLLMTTIFVARPLDFSAFPSVLLVATLYRLSLNIATTRLILGNAGEKGVEAAGETVKLFGSFVGGNDIFIGVTIFFILFIIQFIVITKGATRISEVAARFTLDAMPGQQMAIDADLNAGLIDDKQAKLRREELRQTTDFYGAMDGASKFVRGDANAGIIITIINILVGFIIGMVRYDMPVAESAKVFTILTIGDGLVTQIPALFISIASGLIVTRSASRGSMGKEVIGQVFGQRHALGMTAIPLLLLGVLGLLRVAPLPAMPLLTVGTALAVGWYFYNREALTAVEGAASAQEAAAQTAAAKAAEKVEEKPEDYLHVDTLALEIGYGLVPLVQAENGGGLLGRVQMIRRQMATDFGFVVPPVRIRDAIRLEPNEYDIRIHGGSIATGTVVPDRLLAMDPGTVTAPVDGIATTEPAFGLDAVWIMPAQQSEAERLGYTVVDPETVVATHLTEVIKNRAHELLTREEVRKLIDNIREQAGTLVQEIVPALLSLADIQKVLQNLLREHVSVRNLETILEVLGDYGRRTKDAEILTEYVRAAMGRAICSQVAEGRTIHVINMDPRLEEHIQQAIKHTESGMFLTLPPVEVEAIIQAIAKQLQHLLTAGHQSVILVSPQIRPTVRRMTERSLPLLAVLSYSEITPEYTVESSGMVTFEGRT